MLTFEGDAAFTGNNVTTTESVERGYAGAVSNIGSGSIWFKGKLIVQDSEAEVSSSQSITWVGVPPMRHSAVDRGILRAFFAQSYLC